MRSKQPETKKKAPRRSHRAKAQQQKEPRSRRPKKGSSISLRTTAVLLTVGFEFLRIVERNYDVVSTLLTSIMNSPNQAPPIIEAVLAGLDQETKKHLRIETRSSAETATRLTSYLFMLDELLQNLTPSAAISICYVALRDLLFKERKPTPSENDQLFEWVYAIAQHFPIVQNQLAFLAQQGEAQLAKWKREKREIALYEFRKRLSNVERVKRIEADLRSYLSKFFDED